MIIEMGKISMNEYDYEDEKEFSEADVAQAYFLLLKKMGLLE